MMWAFALWGICHIGVYPVAANIIVAAAIIILALVGAALQDRKKEALQPHTWPGWEKGRALGRLARLSPVRRGSAVSACTRSPVVSSYGSPQPGGAHSARRLAGAHLALPVAGALRHTPTSARVCVNSLRRRSHIGPRGLARPVPVNDRFRQGFSEPSSGREPTNQIKHFPCRWSSAGTAVRSVWRDAI
jgi:hypothetical protein